ncbi:MAG TPA: FG-GAP-like repeat-containing protein, partial [Pseudidiomarina sp.]|nr:FG-GAP-like repeat-containing protein [Pseudidiomarina sp.]
MRVFASKTTLVWFAFLIYFVSTPVFAGSSYVTATNPLITAGAELADNGSVDPIVIDYDNDGDLDFIAYNTATMNFTRLFTNNGSGSYTASTIPFTIAASGSVRVLDVDNDGDDDITEVVSGGARYHRNNGNGTFTEATHPVIAAGGELHFNASVDFFTIDANNDGAIDFVTFNVGTNSYSNLYLNNGSGSFTLSSLGTTAAKQLSRIDVADTNNDGADDITVVNDTTGAVTYLQNNGSGSFSVVTHPVVSAGGELVFNNTGAGKYDLDFLTQDYDADGDIDYFVYGTTNYDVVYVNDGSGNYTRTTISFGLPSFRGTLFADIDNDGDDDVILSTGGETTTYRRHDGTVSGTNNRPPRLSSTSPADGSSGFTPNANITLTFDESIPSVGGKRINIYRQSNDSLVESIAANNGSRVSTSGSTVTVNPTSDLLASTGYYVQVEAGALFDADGMTYQGIDDKTTLNFTTGTAGVALSTNPTLRFTSNSGLTDFIANDGDGNSTAITDLDIQIFDTTDATGTLRNTLQWSDSNFFTGTGNGDPDFQLLTYEGTGNAGTKGFAIQSDDGAEFKLNSFTYLNWGEGASTTNTVDGYRNGSIVATYDYEAWDADFLPKTITLPASFNNVDKVVVYISAGGYAGDQSLTNHAFNDFSLSPPVANTAPTVANAIADFSVNEDAANSTFNLANVFTDTETAAGNLTFSIQSNNNTGLVGASLDNGTDILTLSYAANASGTATIAVRATDGGGLTVDETFTVTVTSANDAPTDIALSNASVNQSGGANAVVGTLSSTDIDDANHTYTLVSGTGDTNNSAFNINGTTLRANDAGALANGSYSVRVRATDAGSLSFEKAFSVTVVDDIPTNFENGTPTISEITQTSFRVTGDFDAFANFYIGVTLDGAGSVTANDIFQEATFSGGPERLLFADIPSTSSEPFITSRVVTGLERGTDYDVYLYVEDGQGNFSNVTQLDVTTSNVDSDGNLTTGPSYNTSLASTVDTVGEAVDIFGFTLSDGGTADGLPMTVTQVVVNVSGTSTDAQRGQMTWRLNGPDAANVTGVYNAGADTVTFSSLSISVADGANEDYTINAYFNDNSGITDNATTVLSIDGDTDVTTSSTGTGMGATTAVTNNFGLLYAVTADRLVFTTQPAGSISGSALSTQPVVTAQDAFGNTDVTFAGDVYLAVDNAGSISGGFAAASQGVATFTAVNYTATADQESFTLIANGTAFDPVEANA